MLVLFAGRAVAQETDDPFPPLDTTHAIIVRVTDFARIPDVGGQPARMMLLVDEPGTHRLFINDMRGPIYSVSYDGKTVTPYVDVDNPRWNVQVQSGGRERGVQSFAFHPQFAQAGTPGYGRFYTWADVRDINQPVDFKPSGGNAPATPPCTNGVRRTPLPSPMMVLRRGSSSGSSSPSPTTTAACSRSTRSRERASPISVCST